MPGRHAATNGDWPTRQDAQITETLSTLDQLASDPSVVRRVLALTDLFITEKHLLNVHLVKRRTDAFRVLDVGCGSAEFLAQLVDDFPRAECVGLEPNAAALQRARARELPRCEFSAGSFEAARGQFDLVVCSEVYEHVADPGRLLDTLCASLVPGGYLSISTPSGWMYRTPRLYNLVKVLQNPGRFWRVYLHPERHWAEALPAHPAILPATLRRQLEARGLTVIQRQSALWWIQQPGLTDWLLLRINTRRAALLYYNWCRLLDAALNLWPPLRYWETRAIWLLRAPSP